MAGDTPHIATPATTPDGPPRLALRPKEMAAALGIGERLLWERTNRGEIPHVKIGRCTLYPVHLAREWLAGQAEGGRDDRC